MESTQATQCKGNCLECAKVCLQTLGYCLERGGDHAEPAHIKQMLECAKLCQTNGELMLLGTETAGELRDLCAAACLRCAESCERFPDDEQMRNCAETCRQCAEGCQAAAS